MDYYVTRMLTDLSTNTELTSVEIAPAVAAAFVGSTGYIDQITPADFISRKADVLLGKDQHGRQFISILVLDTCLSARLVLAVARGEELDENARRGLAWASKPRVLTLFQRYWDRDDLFVTAGDISLGGPVKALPSEFSKVLYECGERVKLLTQKALGTPAAEVPVPSRRVRAVEGYHIDGTVGVIDL